MLMLKSFFFSLQNHSERFVFITEWYDPNASLYRRYELLYYPEDGSVEMVNELFFAWTLAREWRCDTKCLWGQPGCSQQGQGQERGSKRGCWAAGAWSSHVRARPPPRDRTHFWGSRVFPDCCSPPGLLFPSRTSNQGTRPVLISPEHLHLLLYIWTIASLILFFY